MKQFIGRFAAVAVAVLALGMPAGGALSQVYPSKPIRFVVALPPGSTTDILARLVAQKLAESWKQPVTVENRAGGGTVLGSEFVARAPSDGYTLLLVGVAIAVNPSLRSDLPYDAEKSFAPVVRLGFSPTILTVHPSLPVNSVRELITLAKSRPGQLNHASPGNGSAAHIAGQLLNLMAGINTIHVPYKGTPPATVALLTGEVSLMFAQLPLVRPHILSGRLRALAVASDVRSQAMPDLPTVAEAGVPGFKIDSWFGVFAPAGTPSGIVFRLNNEIRKIMRMPDIRQRLVPEGVEPATNTPEDFAAYTRAEIANWAELVKKTGARVD